MNQSEYNELQFHKSIFARYAPFFDAVGVDCSNWNPYDVYRLASIVDSDKTVEALYAEKLAVWNRDEKPDPATIPETVAGYMSLLPPPDFLLNIVKALPAEAKRAIKARVLAAKGKV